METAALDLLRSFVDGHEPLGYLASLLVLATFCMHEMVPLRVLAIASNIAFVAYAALAGLDPILLLHALLLPMNAWRLVQALAEQRRARTACRRLANPAAAAREPRVVPRDA